ncbi:hypothetical protein [Emcibacter nanhaiensis]|uniref:Uncharacterized protein n=1 Tax=Emcibacter nanhaiensis TaxID=1505037 RepID=A0A501PSK9_9PROT|nr:hypothetical protein [Emcibacter nanhaiensis]TPD63032.1 hypothetical protein FIV46_02835 [Emcibacter nanhaiensis]
MQLEFENQEQVFSWRVARRNARFGAIVSAIVITLFLLVEAFFNFLGGSVEWWMASLPLSLAALSYGAVLIEQPCSWWWKYRWSTDRRRKWFTFIMILLVVYAPLLSPSLRDHLFEPYYEKPFILTVVFLSYSWIVGFLAMPIGAFLSWFLLSLLAMMKKHVRLAHRIHSYFWRDKP